MTTIDTDKLEAVCSEVWRDRSAVLEGRGFLSLQAALARAVYWRLCKTTVSRFDNSENYAAAQTFSTYYLAVNCLLQLNARPPFDSAPFLQDLIQRCEDEIQAHRNEPDEPH
jgi:hypothetical protein